MSRHSKLDDLTQEQRNDLAARLYDLQGGLCYIDQKPIDLRVHRVDVDHIIALDRGGPDNESNWALTHASCNRAKGHRDLQPQRHIATLGKHLEKYRIAGDMSSPNFTLHEALQELVPARQDVGVRIQGQRICLSFNDQDKPQTLEFPIIVDQLSRFRSFVGMIPTCLLHHLRAYRICRAAAATVWVEQFRLAVTVLLSARTRYRNGSWSQYRPLWAEIKNEDWESIRKMLRAVVQHKIWAVRVGGEVLSALSSTKQGDWQELLLKGRLPGRMEESFLKLDQNFIFLAGVS